MYLYIKINYIKYVQGITNDSKIAKQYIYQKNIYIYQIIFITISQQNCITIKRIGKEIWKYNNYKYGNGTINLIKKTTIIKML